MRAGWEVATLRETDILLYGSAREDLPQHTTQRLGLRGRDSSGLVWREKSLGGYFTKAERRHQR